MFHIFGHIYNLVLVQNLSETLILNSNLVCTFHLIIWFFPPTLFLVYLFCIPVWNIKWLLAVLWLGVLEALWLWQGALKVLWLKMLTALWLGMLDILQMGMLKALGCILDWFSQPPSQSSLCSSLFLQMGKCGPHEHFSVTCFGITMAWGIAAILSCSSVLMVGAGVGTGVGWIGQSFLVSNRFSEADPALGQGVPCLPVTLGISSCGEGLVLLFGDLGVGWGISANCPIANLYTITSIDSIVDLAIGVCVLTVATMGGAVEGGVESVGWMSTLTLYLLLVVMVFLLLSGMFVLGPGDFLTLGLVRLVMADFVANKFAVTGFFVGAWTWYQVSLPILSMFSSSIWGRGTDGALCSRDCTWLPGMSCLFWMHGCLAWSSLSLPHLHR